MMISTYLKSKIHRATVTEANLNYEGSLTLDSDLMLAAGLREHEQVAVVNINNGHRFETYLIAGKAGSQTVCLNGAAARLGEIGDKIIIIAYVGLSENEYQTHQPKVVFVDANNRIQSPATAD
jgi:aspartate 1-decarboxylase